MAYLTLPRQFLRNCRKVGRRPKVADSTGAELYVNAAGMLNVAVANENGCLFTRASAGGLDAIAQSLAQRRGLTLEHARQWMTHVGLVTPIDEIEGDMDLVSATRTALEDGVRELADGIRTSLNFYRTQDAADAGRLTVAAGLAVAERP